MQVKTASKYSHQLFDVKMHTSRKIPGKDMLNLREVID